MAEVISELEPTSLEKATKPTAVQPVHTRQSQSTKELVELQTTLPGAVGTMYKLLQENKTMNKEELQLASPELCRLNELRDSLYIQPDGVLMVRLPKQARTITIPVCPAARRQKVI